jgi:enoyl-CoA hydratase
MAEIRSTDEVKFEARGTAGLITLDRPKALNALTHAMCLAIDGALKAWAADPAIASVIVQGAGDRAFCAGGDVRAIWEDGMALKRGEGGGTIVREFFRDEYRMNRRIKFFPKPYVAVIDGITMGGGVGLSIHGSHRIATERTLFAMPETGIGLFPDVGASFALPRLPGETGAYLGLTGARVRASDLVPLGIATHFVPSGSLDALIADLGAAAGEVDAALARHAADLGAPDVIPNRAVIDRCFAQDRVEAILAALDADPSAFAQTAAETIRTMSPTSLKLSLAAIRRGRAQDFDRCMITEYRLTQSILAGHDFYEGVRAQLIDKDRSPKWNPPTLELVTDAMVEACFAPPPHGDLTFPD